MIAVVRTSGCRIAAALTDHIRERFGDGRARCERIDMGEGD